MNYFEQLIEKNEDIKLINKKNNILKQNIYNIDFLRDRLITIAEIEMENSNILNDL